MFASEGTSKDGERNHPEELKGTVLNIHTGLGKAPVPYSEI